ncbi:MAG: redoxin domain-containing protein [Bacteroidales bacterium]|nr:redoxin domain-containing protein [Bacteroidales bacterium]
MRVPLLIIFFLTFIFFETHAQTPAQTIPAFTFYKLDKTPFTNKNLAVGKDILFIFFDVTCDHCQHTISTLSKRISECQKIAIYLISMEDKAAINNFFALYGKNLPGQKNVTILQDTQNQFITQFNPRKYPSVFLYSAQKKLRLYDDDDQYLEKFFKLISPSKK